FPVELFDVGDEPAVCGNVFTVERFEFSLDRYRRNTKGFERDRVSVRYRERSNYPLAAPLSIRAPRVALATLAGVAFDRLCQLTLAEVREEAFHRTTPRDADSRTLAISWKARLRSWGMAPKIEWGTAC